MKAAQDDDNEKRVDRLDVAKVGDRTSVSHSTIDLAPSPTRSTSACRGLCKVDSASGFKIGSGCHLSILVPSLTALHKVRDPKHQAIVLASSCEAQ